MGNLWVQPKVRSYDQSGYWVTQVFDAFFSTTYGAGGDSFVTLDIEKLMPGLGQNMTYVQAFRPELVQTLAQGTLTSDGTNVANAETVTIGVAPWGGARTYTFKTSLAGAGDDDILIGANAAASLANLAAAINGTAGFGTTYASRGYRNPQVTASVAGNVLTTTARILGAEGNLATSELAAHLSWGGANMTGGALAGWSVELDRANKKLSMWNGTTENATADVHLRAVRCAIVYFDASDTRMGYN